MPAQYLPIESAIQLLEIELVRKRGFTKKVGLCHFREATKDETLIPPRVRPGRELGFVFTKDRFTAVIWTGWLPGEKRSREQDSGWIVIEEDGKGIYFSQLRRTRNFIDRILMEAKIARARIRTRPDCPRCGNAMSIVHGKGLGSCYWRCKACQTREGWDHEAFLKQLSKEALDYLARKRKRRRTYYQKRRGLGLPIRSAVFTRKKWIRKGIPIEGF